MNKPDLLIETSFLATKDRPYDRDLSCGKLESSNPSGGFLFYVIELATIAESSIIKKIIQVLSNSTKTTPTFSVDMFEKSLAMINDTLGRLSQTSDSAWIGNVNAVIGYVENNEIMISQAGNITGYIFRKNKISSLTEKPEDEICHPNRTFTDIISGQISEGDQLIFGNNDLFNLVSLDRFRNITRIQDVREEAVELSRLLKKARFHEANAIFIKAGGTSARPDLPEVVFVDIAEESVLKSAAKKTMPVIKNAYDFIKPYAIKAAKEFYMLAKKAKKNWDEKYGPKSKELLMKGGNSLKTTITTARTKIEKEMEPKFKIQTHGYEKYSKPAPTKEWVAKTLQKLSPAAEILKKRNRKFLYAILIIIAISIGYWKVQENNSKRSDLVKQVQIKNAYEQARELFVEAKENLALGKTTNLDQLNEALALAEQAKGNQANYSNSIALIEEINTILDEKTKTVRIYPDKGYSISEDLAAVTLSGSLIYSVNGDGKIFLSDTRDKSTKLVGSIGTDKGNAIDLFTSSSSGILILTDNNRVLSFDEDSKTVEELKVDDTTSDWQAPTAIASYSTNIYGLNSILGSVYKFVAKETGYAKGTSYADTKKVSLNGAVDFAIDGNIYILQNDGRVLKFVKGAYETDFSVKGIPAPNSQIASPAKIYTDENTNSIFVLDRKTNRIIKFDKSGDFTNQYVFDGISIDNFVVNAKLQKIWAISGGKVFEGDL